METFMSTLGDGTIGDIALSPEFHLQEKLAMTNQLALSQLTTQQLKDLIWDLRGTPQVQPVYRELSQRPAKLTLKPDDPEWEKKTQGFLTCAE